MSYSLAHTITYTGTSSRTDAAVYLYDTILANQSNVTVSAHPDSSSTKRKIVRTVTNNVTGSSLDLYYWSSWDTSNIYEYNDATYTTVPGDLGTYNTQSSRTITSNVASDIKFWTSDSNNGVLMTSGGKFLYWDPGITQGLFYTDSAWGPGTTNRGAGYLPQGTDTYTPDHYGAWPVRNSNSSNTAVIPLINMYGSTTRPTGQGELVMGTPVGPSGFDNSNNVRSDLYTTYLYSFHSDAGLYVPASLNETRRSLVNDSNALSVLYNTNNSKYYIMFGLTYGAVVEVGTTEPDIS